MEVAVVILNWNGRNFLEKFLPLVVKYSSDYANVYVADNASTDDSLSFVKTNHPSVKIIENSVNGGFAKGYNDALKHVDAKYYVLLNSDVEVTENWILPLIQLFKSDEAIAVCQPKIKDYNNKNKFEYAGAAGGFIDKYGYTFCRGRIFNSFEQDNGQYDDVKEIFWATGACLFVRADVYHRTGGLDEDFFAHMEEIDLCWRIKNTGYKVMYCPSSTVYHIGGGTLSKNNPRKTFLNFRNNLILLFKNHSSDYFLIKMLLRFLLDGIAGLNFLFTGKFSDFLAVIKAHFSFYKSFGKTLMKRKRLGQLVKTYTNTNIYRRSIVVDYFIRGRKKFSQLDSSSF